MSLFFFFKQKTAYEIMPSLVGSEMCIRDSTYAFDDTAAWLVTHCSKSAVRDLLRIAWRTVGWIVTRVVADAEATTDRFANLRRIGIDEISYKRGHKYLTVIVDHDTGVLLWARPGRD